MAVFQIKISTWLLDSPELKKGLLIGWFFLLFPNVWPLASAHLDPKEIMELLSLRSSTDVLNCLVTRWCPEENQVLLLDPSALVGAEFRASQADKVKKPRGSLATSLSDSESGNF